MFFLADVDYKKDRDSAGTPNSMPTFLVADGVIEIRNRVRIVENPCSGPKRYTVLSPVDSVFLLIPRENIRIYKNVARKPIQD